MAQREKTGEFPAGTFKKWVQEYEQFWNKSATEDSFRQAAHNANVSGDAARHSQAQSDPIPPHVYRMTLSEGQGFIARLLSNWLETK